jgi:hypothetical protein
MNSKTWLIPYAVLLGAILSAPAVGQETAKAPAVEAEKAAKFRMEILNPAADSKTLERTDLPTVQRLRVCTGNFSTDYIDPETGGAHLELEDKFWVLGPIPYINAYVIRPLSTGPRTHPWVSGNYTILPHPTLVGFHQVKNVPVTPHTPDPIVGHSYIIQIRNFDENNCPTYIEFWHGEHPFSSTSSLHPGHAGAIRE